MQNAQKIEEIFRTVAGENPPPVGPDVTPLLLIAVIGSAVAAGVMATRWWLRHRETAEGRRGRLTATALKQLGLDRDARRTLHQLTRQLGVASPLTLLLCPSLLRKGLKNATGPGATALRNLI